MSDLAPDQMPDAWSVGAPGDDAAFAPLTGLYVDEILDRLGVAAGTTLLDVARRFEFPEHGIPAEAILGIGVVPGS